MTAEKIVGEAPKSASVTACDAGICHASSNCRFLPLSRTIDSLWGGWVTVFALPVVAMMDPLESAAALLQMLPPRPPGGSEFQVANSAPVVSRSNA
jgi:hypothetical protein